MALADEILARQQVTQDEQLRQADKSASWTNTFSGPQSTEALRATRNLTDLVSQALDRKAQLLAQTDEHAANIYSTNQRLKIYQDQAPLRDAHLRAQTQAEEAHAARLAAQGIHEAQKNAIIDTQSANLHGGIAALNEQFTDRADPRYHAAVFDLANKNYIAAKNDPVTQELLRHTAETADTARYNAMYKQSWRDASEYGRKYGMSVITNDQGFPDIDAMSAKVKELKLTPTSTDTHSGGKSAEDAEAKNKYGVSLLDIRNPASTFAGNLDANGKFVQAMGGTHFQVNVRDKPSDTKTRASLPIPRADFERFGGPIGPMDKLAAPASPSATPASISQEDYAKLKPGDSYQWNGKTLTKK